MGYTYKMGDVPLQLRWYTRGSECWRPSSRKDISSTERESKQTSQYLLHIEMKKDKNIQDNHEK